MAELDHAIVSVLVAHDGKYLLVEESKPGREGLFTMPGGHVEGHETLFDAAVREVREESGYSVELTGLVGIYQSIYPHINVSGPVFCAELTSVEQVTASAEHPSTRWVTKDELYELAAAGKLFTKYPPFAVNHYETRGPFPLSLVAMYDYTN